MVIHLWFVQMVHAAFVFEHSVVADHEGVLQLLHELHLLHVRLPGTQAPRIGYDSPLAAMHIYIIACIL